MSSSKNAPQYPKSYWLDIELPSFGSLEEDLTVDVAIVGAGITGITAAYLLSKAGVKVAVIEASTVLNGTTGHTTAKVTAQHNLIYDELISHFGKEKARLYYDSHMDALQFIKKTADENGIHCDFAHEDAYVYAITDQYAEKINSEWNSYQSLGIAGEITTQIPFNIKIKNAIVMKNQARYHPLKFLKGLLNTAVQSGCLIFENTTAKDIKDEEDEPEVLTTNGHSITCKHVIVSSHFPYCDKLGLYFARMYAARSYAIGIKTKQEYPGGMYISADKPTRSIRSTTLMDGGTLWIIGGENHKTGQGIDTLDHYKDLETFAEELFGITDFLYRWSAQDLVTLDKLPYIGSITESKKNIFVATGYKKWGMTTGIAAAQLLTDSILKRNNPYKELYSPSRFQTDPDLKNLITTNADVASHLLKGKLEIISKAASDLKNNEGSVITHNGKRAGAYQDDTGKLYIVDTSCTHLGCETEWNHAEKTWDCPCHGSRYSFTGDVIEGPAVMPLTNLSDGDNPGIHISPEE